MLMQLLILYDKLHLMSIIISIFLSKNGQNEHQMITIFYQFMVLQPLLLIIFIVIFL